MKARLFKALVTAAPKNDVRYYFNSVHLEREKYNSKSEVGGECDVDQILVVVTNGNYILKVKVDASFAQNMVNNGEEITFAIKPLADAMKTFSVNDSLEITKQDSEWFIKKVGDERSYKLLDVVDCRYPSWRRLWTKVPVHADIDKGIGVSADLLMQVSKVFNSVDAKKHSPMKMNFGDPLDPIHFTAPVDEDGVFSVNAKLMPYIL